MVEIRRDFEPYNRYACNIDPFVQDPNMTCPYCGSKGGEPCQGKLLTETEMAALIIEVELKYKQQTATL